MVDSANGFPEDESEFDKTGLTQMPAVKIKAPRVAEAPIHLECKLNQFLGTAEPTEVERGSRPMRWMMSPAGTGRDTPCPTPSLALWRA
jgi:hypothetical protein